MHSPGEVEILLVEDNPHDAELALRALKKNNLANSVVVVTDGEEALDFIFARGAFSQRKVGNGPKVILLDLKLPKVDGLQVLRAIKGDSRTQSIPVVVLTSSTEEKDNGVICHLNPYGVNYRMTYLGGDQDEQSRTSEASGQDTRAMLLAGVGTRLSLCA